MHDEVSRNSRTRPHDGTLMAGAKRIPPRYPGIYKRGDR
jgi:hypothetical protein